MSSKVSSIDDAMRKRHGLNVQPFPVHNKFSSAHDMLLMAIEGWDEDKTPELKEIEENTDATSALGLLFVAMKALAKELDVDPAAMIQARKNFGLEKYGTVLQPYNGRNNVEDALDEVIDGLVYLMCKMYENGFDENGVSRDGSTTE